ncbi:hypothetical protein KDA00_01700 [Candidatus Saccharibacteria bacterium]|nr:hypothetical protein [Candidatus Saccharibacteria bacterium]
MTPRAINIIISALLISLFALTMVLVLPKSTMSYDPFDDTLCSEANTNGGDTPSACDASSDDPFSKKSGQDGLIIKVTNLVSIGVAIVSTIMIILGGFTYVMSSGDPQKISAAKNTIIYAIIGLAVALFAQLILQLVLTRL